jgi:hypothetical protein
MNLQFPPLVGTGMAGVRPPLVSVSLVLGFMAFPPFTSNVITNCPGVPVTVEVVVVTGAAVVAGVVVCRVVVVMTVVVAGRVVVVITVVVVGGVVVVGVVVVVVGGVVVVCRVVVVATVVVVVVTVVVVGGVVVTVVVVVVTVVVVGGVVVTVVVVVVGGAVVTGSVVVCSIVVVISGSGCGLHQSHSGQSRVSKTLSRPAKDIRISKASLIVGKSSSCLVATTREALLASGIFVITSSSSPAR